MINHINIKGYKSIKDTAIELTPINILIGSNGVGKSNFISFFKLLNEIYEKRLENFSLKKGSESLLYFGHKITPEIEGYIEFDHKNGYKFTLEPTENNTLIIKKEQGRFDGKKGLSFSAPHWFDKTFGSNLKESQLKGINDENGIGFYVSHYLQSFKIYHFHDTSATSKLRTPAMITDNIRLREDGDNLPSFLYFLQEKHPKHFKRIERTIKTIAPYFDGFHLLPDRIAEDRINLEWRATGHPDFPFNAHHLSDGTIRFIALSTLLMQPDLPKTIIIDEPEIGLHPVAIHKLSGLIKKASAKCQIIIATQSANLVSHFNPSDIITVDRVNNESVFDRPDEEKLESWLEEFTLGDLWLKNMIKGQPF